MPRTFGMRAASHFQVVTPRGKFDVFPDDEMKIQFPDDDPQALEAWAESMLFWAECVLGPVRCVDPSEHGEDL